MNTNTKVSFVSWVPWTPSLIQEWLTVFKHLCHTNRRDRNCEILVVIPIPQVVYSPPTSEQAEAEAAEAGDADADAKSLQSSSNRNQIEKRIYDTVCSVRDATKEQKRIDCSEVKESEIVLEPFFCDPNNVRTFGLPESEGILSFLNFLGYKARGTYIKIFHAKEHLNQSQVLTARDIRSVFERNPSKLGSVAHFWEGSTEDEAEFCSFVLTKNVFLGTGGFHLHTIPGQEQGQGQGTATFSDLLKINIAWIQMCQLYDCYLEHAVKKNKLARKNVFIVNRSCPQAKFKAFSGMVLTDSMFPLGKKSAPSSIPPAALISPMDHHPSVLFQMLSKPLIEPNPRTIISQLTLQTGFLKSQIDEFYQAIPETKMKIPENAKEATTPPPSQHPSRLAASNSSGGGGALSGGTQQRPSTGSGSGSGSNIVGFSWWNRRQEEKKQEQEHRLAIQRLENLRNAIGHRSAVAERTEDSVSGWEMLSIVFAVIFVLLMIVSITLSIIALSRSSVSSKVH